MPQSILVIEDYPDLRAAITEMLTQNDCACDSVDSNGAMEKLAAKHYERILIAPRLSIAGDPVLHYLLEQQPCNMENVVVMTNPAGDDETADERCHVLTKPFSREQLLAVLR
jgi:CheY-like chemotaxis protein